MRAFNKMRSTFWGSGETGRLLRPHPEATKLLAVWMFSNDKALAEPWGLYHCPKTTMVEGPSLTPAKVGAGLATLAELGYAFFDARTEWLWVVGMAAEQVLTEGRPLKSTDHMVTAANRWYARCPNNPFLGPFFDRYLAFLHLEARREGPAGDLVGAPPTASVSVASVPAQPVLLPEATMALVPAKLSPAERREGEFDAFWAAYHPKGRNSRSRTKATWMKLKPDFDTVMAGLALWTRSRRWAEGFVVDASKFLNEERWKETPEVAVMPGASERTTSAVEALNTGRSIFDLEDMLPAHVQEPKDKKKRGTG